MSILTLASLIGGFTVLIISILLGGTLGAFVDVPSIFVTIGGTIAAVLMSFPVEELKMAQKAAGLFLKKDVRDPNADIDMIIEMANTARKGGLLALENVTGNVDNNFIKKGVMLVVDGSSSELVKAVMQTEIDNISMRHEKAINVYKRAAGYAPAFGMIGTLIGLINMLIMLDDPGALGPAMSVALVTTFYGCIMANLIFTPIALKLEAMSDSEELQNQMVLEGILSIQDGENPRIIRDKLEAFVPASKKKVQAPKE